MAFSPASRGHLRQSRDHHCRDASFRLVTVLTPVLCASFLKPVQRGNQPGRGRIWFLRPSSAGSTVCFFPGANHPLGLVVIPSAEVRYVVCFCDLGGWGYSSSKCPPPIFLMRIKVCYGNGHAAANSTLEQTKQVMAGVKDYFLNDEKTRRSLMGRSGVSSPAGDRTRPGFCSAQRLGPPNRQD